jgi:hypothetical protein
MVGAAVAGRREVTNSAMNVDELAFSLSGVAQVLDLSLAEVTAKIDAGEIASVQRGGARVVLKGELDRLTRIYAPREAQEDSRDSVRQKADRFQWRSDDGSRMGGWQPLGQATRRSSRSSERRDFRVRKDGSFGDRPGSGGNNGSR